MPLPTLTELEALRDFETPIQPDEKRYTIFYLHPECPEPLRQPWVVKLPQGRSKMPLAEALTTFVCGLTSYYIQNCGHQIVGEQLEDTIIMGIGKKEDSIPSSPPAAGREPVYWKKPYIVLGVAKGPINTSVIRDVNEKDKELMKEWFQTPCGQASCNK